MGEWIDNGGSHKCCGEWQMRYTCNVCGMLSGCVDCNWFDSDTEHDCKGASDHFAMRLNGLIFAVAQGLPNAQRDLRKFVTRSSTNWRKL
jgi:hypothetical protein